MKEDDIANAICAAGAPWIAEPLPVAADLAMARAALVEICIISDDAYSAISHMLENPPMPTQALRDLLNKPPPW